MIKNRKKKLNKHVRPWNKKATMEMNGTKNPEVLQFNFPTDTIILLIVYYR